MSANLISELYPMALENSEPNNYTRIPNFISYLTYDHVDEKTGEIKVKRLSVFARELYRVLKDIAGQENICWMSSEKIAEIAGMSKTAVLEGKKELQNKFHQLDGNPLIEIVEKRKITQKDGQKINGTTYHQIVIKCIWNFNRAFFLLKKIEKEKARTQNVHAIEQDRQATEPSQGTQSPNDRNKITCSKTPLFKEQDSTAGAVLVGSSNISIDVRTQAFNWLMQIGFDILSATNILNNFAVNEIIQASDYVKKQIEKKKKKLESIRDPLGYFRRTLENKWWA